jgi:hypothetical protein
LQVALRRLNRPEDPTESAHRTAALGEHLKLLFNIAVFYPRLLVIDPHGGGPNHTPSLPSSPALSTSSSPRLEGSPRVGRSGAPADNLERVSSLGRRGAGAIRGLFGRSKSSSNGSSRPGSPEIGGPPSGKTSPKPDVPTGQGALLGRGFDALVASLIALVVSLPSTGPLPGPPLNHAIHALSEFPLSDAWTALVPSARPLPRPLPCASSADPSTAQAPALPPLPARLLSILDSATLYYCPNDPDGADVIAKLDPDADFDVDAGLATILLLLRKMIVGEKSDGGLCKAFRDRLLPVDMCALQASSGSR